jgi:NAD-dependent SIR2 family protein deacetylase
MPRRPKTVFILGAGFSVDAGIPMQGELLSNILAYDLTDDLAKCRRRLLRFIKKTYCLNRKQAAKIDLEDIYTPIHQSISNNEYIKSYSPDNLKSIENDLNRLVSHVIDNGKIEFNSSYDYIENFVDKLIQDKCAAPSTDHFSIISLNWDIVLDKRLFTAFYHGAIDYCCHCTGIDNENKIMPSLIAKAKDIPSIKLLKLHGSLNWVTCPKCQRVFINKKEKAALKAFTGETMCRFCNGVLLNAALLLPSFQKDLAKFHFQHIWNQAGIELSEATRIVFVGYSFPLADFDFRSLITKHLNADVKVDIVTYYQPQDRNVEEQGPDEKRYRNFFGDKIQNVYNDGAADFIINHLEIL